MTAAGRKRRISCTVSATSSGSPAGTPEDVAETVQEIRRLRPAAVIVAAAQVSEPYLAELVATGSLIVSLDHLANGCFPSQLVINPLLGPGREAYEFQP